MASKEKKAPLYNVINEDENIFFEGKPEKIPYIVNSCKDDFLNFLLDVLFKCVLIPFLFSMVYATLPLKVVIISIGLWIIYLLPTLSMIKIPFIKAKEYKNTYYIVTDKSIYIQFGVKQIYYRIYPNNRIGTRVFYRANRIDNMFGVGTLGFSVDDYYEERLISVNNYESLYNVLKEVTNSRKEELQRLQEEREAKKREFEEQAKLLAQEELFLQQQEMEEEKKRREKYEREMQEVFEREQREHERYLRDREERKRREEEIRRIEEEARVNDFLNRRRKEADDDDDDDDDADTYDMFGVETEDRPPSEKTIANYRSKYATPSIASHRRNSARRTDKRSIKFAPDERAEDKNENNNLDMNRLWSNASEDNE